MLLNGIKYLFFSIYKITSVNYGKEGGAYASFVIVSILASINTITLLGLFNKLIFESPHISLLLLWLTFLALLICNYFFLIHRSKYKKIISSFEMRQTKNISATIKVLTYVIISFVLLVMVISIRQ